MPSPPEARNARGPVDVSTLRAYLSGSIGQEKAGAELDTALAALGLPKLGKLQAEDAERVLDRISLQPGLVGLAAKVSRQMMRLGMEPLKATF